MSRESRGCRHHSQVTWYPALTFIQIVQIFASFSYPLAPSKHAAGYASESARIIVHEVYSGSIMDGESNVDCGTVEFIPQNRNPSGVTGEALNDCDMIVGAYCLSRLWTHRRRSIGVSRRPVLQWMLERVDWVEWIRTGTMNTGCARSYRNCEGRIEECGNMVTKGTVVCCLFYRIKTPNGTLTPTPLLCLLRCTK